jgi:malic enzyme
MVQSAPEMRNTFSIIQMNNNLVFPTAGPNNINRRSSTLSDGWQVTSSASIKSKVARISTAGESAAMTFCALAPDIAAVLLSRGLF